MGTKNVGGEYQIARVKHLDSKIHSDFKVDVGLEIKKGDLAVVEEAMV